MEEEQHAPVFRQREASETSSLIVQDHDDQHTFSVEGRKYFVTKKRWLILAIVCAILFLDAFGAMFFAYVNDVTSAYFGQDPAVTDFVSTCQIVGRGLFSLPVAVFSDHLNFRTMTTATIRAVFSGGVLVVVSVMSRDNFPILIIGQTVNGMASATAIALGEMTAGNWFPKREHGFVLAFTVVFKRISAMISNIVATHSLGISRYEQRILVSGGGIDTVPSLATSFRTVYSVVFASIVGIVFSLAIFSELFVTVHPALVDHTDDHMQSSARLWDWDPLSGLKRTLKMFENRVYLLVLFHSSLYLAMRPLNDVLLSSIVLKGFPNLSDQFAGTMYCVGIAGISICLPFIGAFLDRFQKYERMYVGAVVVGSVGCALLSVAIHVQSTSLLYIGYIALTFSRDIISLCLMVAVVKTMTNESQVTKFRGFSLVGLSYIFVPVYAFAIRKTMDAFGTSIAVLLPVPFLSLSAIMWVRHYELFAEASLPMLNLAFEGNAQSTRQPNGDLRFRAKETE